VTGDYEVGRGRLARPLERGLATGSAADLALARIASASSASDAGAPPSSVIATAVAPAGSDRSLSAATVSVSAVARRRRVRRGEAAPGTSVSQ
jgi:hypothetical protein